jgi:hypothetical protein
VHSSFETARQLLENIPRLEPVLAILAAIDTPDGPVGARVLRAAMDFDSLQARGYSARDAVEALESHQGGYDRALLDAIVRLRGGMDGGGEVQEVAAGELTPGVFVAEDIHTSDGILIVPRGVQMTRNVIAHIRKFNGNLKKKTVRVSARPAESVDRARASSTVAG